MASVEDVGNDKPLGRGSIAVSAFAVQSVQIPHFHKDFLVGTLSTASPMLNAGIWGRCGKHSCPVKEGGEMGRLGGGCG